MVTKLVGGNAMGYEESFGGSYEEDVKNLWESAHGLYDLQLKETLLVFWYYLNEGYAGREGCVMLPVVNRVIFNITRLQEKSNTSRLEKIVEDLQRVIEKVNLAYRGKKKERQVEDVEEVGLNLTIIEGYLRKGDM